MLNLNFFRAKTFNIFYILGREKNATSSFRAPIKPRKFPQKHLENPQKHLEFPTSDVFLPLYRLKKEEKAPCLGLFPLRLYKDNTFSREMQIVLTFRNNPRNVKRRVLHKTGSAVCYITRAFRFLGFRCGQGVYPHRKRVYHTLFVWLREFR